MHVQMKLELVPVPVSDVDRAKAFYVEKIGFNPDHDHRVSDDIRFVQLTPVYTGGAVLENDAELSIQETAAPLELDEIYQSIDDLMVALGPEGANKDGALSNLLDVTARNFAGQGDQFNQTLENLGKFTGTLENNKEELFGTAQEMQRFVAALAETTRHARAVRGQFGVEVGDPGRRGQAVRPHRRRALEPAIDV